MYTRVGQIKSDQMISRRFSYQSKADIFLRLMVYLTLSEEVRNFFNEFLKIAKMCKKKSLILLPRPSGRVRFPTSTSFFNPFIMMGWLKVHKNNKNHY